MLYLFVAIGCALGGVCRFWGTTLVTRWLGDSFPWGTLFVNVLGSFLLGATLGAGLLPSAGESASGGLHAFLAVGFCGGLTTFSTFSLQNLSLLSKRSKVSLGLNIAANVFLCLLVTAGGYSLAERWAA